jgi:hypothetical protein
MNPTTCTNIFARVGFPGARALSVASRDIARSCVDGVLLSGTFTRASVPREVRDAVRARAR